MLGSNRKLPSAADLVSSTSVPLHAGHEVSYIIANSRMLEGIGILFQANVKAGFQYRHCV